MEKLNSAAITRGLYIAAITFALQIILYYVSPQILASMSYKMAISFISLGIYIYFTIDLRKAIGGFWTFSTALKGLLLMSLVANFVSLAATAIFYKFIESSAYERMLDLEMAAQTKMLENFGTPQDKIDEALVGVEKQIKAMYDPTFMDLLKSFGIVLITAVILSLIFAAIFKKNPPVFAATESED
jgi:hypothetical protein